MAEDRSVHDNNLYAYAVICDQRQIMLHTEFVHGSATEYTDVVFSGVVAHYFEDVLSGNILFDINEVDPETIVRERADLFAGRKNYGWPDGIRYRDVDDLVGILRRLGVRGYEIGSSYGMSGWVLAAAMAIRNRETRFPQ